jgi:hypothetical protein
MRVIVRTAFEPETRSFFPTPWCRCPQCGTGRVEISRKPDQIDSTSHRPASLLQHLLGGQLYHCLGCRLQFYDVRPLRVSRRA